jgi:hypothetical protein
MTDNNTSMMLYDERENGNILFFFADLPIIEVLSFLPKSYKIKDLYLMASNYKQEYIFKDDIKNTKSVKNMVDFFTKNDQYSIDDMDATLQNDIEISVHDDNEITFTFPKDYKYNKFINKLLDKFNYNSENVVSALINNKNKYVSIGTPDSILKVYSDFSEYWHENE